MQDGQAASSCPTRDGKHLPARQSLRQLQLVHAATCHFLYAFFLGPSGLKLFSYTVGQLISLPVLPRPWLGAIIR